MIPGEWWVTDGGTEFADGDVGNADHEMIAFSTALGLPMSDEIGDELPAGLEDIACCRLTADEGRALLDYGADAKAVAYFRGPNPDARLYAAKEMGWVRVVTRERSAEVQLWELDDEKLKRLQDGEMWDDNAFEEPNENVSITIEDAKTGWMETVPLPVLLKVQSAAQLVAYTKGFRSGLEGVRGNMGIFARWQRSRS